MYHLEGNLEPNDAASHANRALIHGNYRFMGHWHEVRSYPELQCNYLMLTQAKSEQSPRFGFLTHAAIYRVAHCICNASASSRLWNSMHCRAALASYNPVSLQIIAFALILVCGSPLVFRLLTRRMQIQDIIEEYQSGVHDPSDDLERQKAHYTAHVNCLMKWQRDNAELWRAIANSLAENSMQVCIPWLVNLSYE